MNLHRKVLDAAIAALTVVLRFEQPADSILSNYFHQHHALGQTARAFIAESIFGVLRHKRTLDSITGDGDARTLLLAWLARFSGYSLRELAAVLVPAEIEAMAQLKTLDLESLPVPVRIELPDWIQERLAAIHTPDEMLGLGRAFQEAAPLDVRVNTLRTDRDSALRVLRESGIEGHPTPHSPLGIRIAGKPAISRHELFNSGAIEVQDEGSQLIGYLVAPRRHELVVDFCAGAGGKSLMLGAMMHSQGRVYAFDVSSARLARMKPRLRRSGLSNLHPHLLKNEHDSKVKRLAGKIDRVLVDAPCSGLGTLRRNPDLKWRQSPQSVLELRAKQTAILNAASTLAKPGGRLVYATCSLLAEENDAIVDAFLAAHPDFSALHCGELLEQQGIGLDAAERLRLRPHVHGTDGFFAAVLARTR